MTLDVDAFADGADALARVGDYVILLPGALPGERVVAEITSAARKFGRARVLEVERAAPDRQEARCRHYLACGGCHRQHVVYPAQLRAKAARLRKALEHRLGRDAPTVAQPVAAPAPYGQRHKVALHVLPNPRGPGLVPALHRLRDVDLVPITECPAAAPPAFALACAAVDLLSRRGLRAWSEREQSGTLRSVLVRRAAGTGQSHLIVCTARPAPMLRRLAAELQALGATSVSVDVGDEPGRLLAGEPELLAGPRRIEERLLDTTWCLSAATFFQTAPALAAELVRIVLDGLDPRADDRVVDLYCGAGLFALPLARRARRVVGVEDARAAVADAEVSAHRNGLANATFTAEPVESWVAAARTADRPDLVVLDPPRAGCSPRALRWLAAVRPRRAAYVACDPDALARDLAILRPLGLRATSVVPVDMFPQTWHVEAVALLAGPGSDR